MKRVTAVAFGLAMLGAFMPCGANAQGGPPPMPSGGPPPMPPSASAQYYYNDNGKQAGPFTADQIKQKIASGALTPDTLVWKSGTPSWVALRDLPEFANAGTAASPVAGACNGPTVYLDDNFSETEATQSQSFDSGKLKFKAAPGKVDSFTYTRVISGDADICVTIQIPRNLGKGETFAGLTFGEQANGDFDAFLVEPDATGAVITSRAKQVKQAIPWRNAPGMNAAPGGKNRVRIAVKGSSATISINDTQFGVFNGMQPGGAGKVGVIVKSEEGRRDTWKFIYLKATDFP